MHAPNPAVKENSKSGRSLIRQQLTFVLRQSIELDGEWCQLEDMVTNVDTLAVHFSTKGLKCQKGWENPGLCGIIHKVIEDQGIASPSAEQVKENVDKIMELAHNLRKD